MKLDKLIECVHNELDYSKYESTLVRNWTNCYAHAIGSTLYECCEYYHLGAASRMKPIEEKYFSKEEMKTLFLEDMKILRLEVEELEVSSKEDCLAKVKGTKLEENQHLVMLFAVYYGNGTIGDFHFWRYDNKKGFSEKRFTQYPIFIEEPMRTWRQSYKLLGLFLITR